METPPPAGVSSISGDGQRKSVTKNPGRGARPAGRQDVLKNPEEGRRVETSAPAGVNTRRNDVVEFDITTRRSQRHYATFRSIDGEEYSFRVRDNKGNVLSGIEPFVSMIALVEMMKGGNPLDVLAAFKIKIPAEGGKVVFPIPSEHAHLIQAPNVVELEQSSESAGFSLGE